ncbi:MAG TPA: type II toxin-antitoxin system Phd/YefM family antitoxin, partial [Sulfurovum sp.]|nr:type II toxin-antitoxin system Phd/YefM family antitoxin [Sulfurovum sp.]
MEYISVGDLKSDFSNILNEIQVSGKKYIIEYGKKHKKVAMIIPYDRKLEERADRVFGLLDGQYRVPDNFNEESKE